jgi:hypothetical protein
LTGFHFPSARSLSMSRRRSGKGMNAIKQVGEQCLGNSHLGALEDRTSSYPARRA